MYPEYSTHNNDKISKNTFEIGVSKLKSRVLLCDEVHLSCQYSKAVHLSLRSTHLC